MNSIRRPMKAPTDPITDENLSLLNYPLVGSPKLDGFRCLVTDRPYTSSMKSFPNLFTMRELSDPIYRNLDGELIVGDPTDKKVFNNTSGPLRRIYGEPDFRFYVFDSPERVSLTYEDRWLSKLPKNEGRIIVLEQRILRNPDDVLIYEKEMLDSGFEGIMIRSFYGQYKAGRCTYREKNIFKRKPFVDTEGHVIGVFEAMENMNESFLDERGLLKRSKNQENLVPKDTLGSFYVKAKEWPTPFSASLGKGFTDEDKKMLWDNREKCLGMVVTVKYQLYGSLDAPRLPRITKIRPEWD